ncbi:hypothetical protein GCM10010365_11190 [Streptomyces poonensis]|uniref:Uncharacterized protein n=1 Tax=Streptomyces poonensis TaxID=68255 RepID=A0A918PBF7_9ACTN|nr:hypothetical protein GCM10010365_11190 [Streptomyces poonensis]GLJ87440.1 hypothetical protein GCM10017589_00400 [Streptomyces poonensis]
MRLLADVQDAIIEIEVRPAKADDLSPPEPHGDGEDEGRVERVFAGRGEEEEVERLVQAPGLEFVVVRAGRLGELGDVARDQFLAAGRGERGAPHAVRLLGRCRGGLLLQADEEAAHVRDAEGLQPLRAEQGEEVEPDVRLVLVVRAQLPPKLDDVVQPVRQPLGELRRSGGHGHALVDLVRQLPALGVALDPGLAVGELAGACAVRLEDVDRALVAAVLALGDGAGAVGSESSAGSVTRRPVTVPTMVSFSRVASGRKGLVAGPSAGPLYSELLQAVRSSAGQ